MEIVTQVFKDLTVGFWDELILRGKVKLNGKYVNYDIFKTVRDGDTLRKYIYLQSETGIVEEAQLLSNNGDVLAIKPFSIKKQDDGLLLAFEFTLVVQTDLKDEK